MKRQGVRRERVVVERSVFNYKTESWATREYTLPWLSGAPAGKVGVGDYVILTPLVLLTRDETWINRSDMLSKCDRVARALPDAQQRAQVNDYLTKRLRQANSAPEMRRAGAATLEAFPVLIDYYIALKEDDSEKAAAVSMEKTHATRTMLRDQVQKAAAELTEKTTLFEKPWTSYDEAVQAVATFENFVENMDGHTVINRGDGRGFANEKRSRASSPSCSTRADST